MTASPSLIRKLAKLRSEAIYELPKARLCADAVLAAIEGEQALNLAVIQLKSTLGGNWSLTTATQFMSGRRGEFAADCGLPAEQVRLLLAHQLAKQVCSGTGLGGVSPLDGMDMAKLRALIEQTHARLN